MRELIGRSKKEKKKEGFCCQVAGLVVVLDHLWQSGGSKLR